jgi:hypothetical protein
MLMVIGTDETVTNIRSIFSVENLFGSTNLQNSSSKGIK